MTKVERFQLVFIVKVFIIDVILMTIICTIPYLIVALISALAFVIFNVTIFVNSIYIEDPKSKKDEKKKKQYKNSGNTYRPRKHKYYFKTGHHYTKTRGIS